MFDSLFNLIDTIAVANVLAMSIKMIAVIKPLMAALVILYAIYLAYQALFDAQNMMVMESLRFMGALGLVMTVALSIPWYLDNVVPVVLNSGQGVANALLSPPVGTTAGTLQVMFNKIMLQIDAINDGINMSVTSGASISEGLWSYVMIVFLIVGSIPFLAICTAYLVVAKIMVSFLLIIGPLFIMFSFFPSTRDFFKAWTGQVFNYFLLSVLFPIAFTMFGSILDATIFSGAIGAGSVLISLVLFFVLSFVAVQIPTLASSLSGGMGINGLVGSIAGAAGGIARLMKGSGKNKTEKSPKTPKGDSIAAG